MSIAMKVMIPLYTYRTTTLTGAPSTAYTFEAKGRYQRKLIGTISAPDGTDFRTDQGRTPRIKVPKEHAGEFFLFNAFDARESAIKGECGLSWIPACPPG